MADKITPLVLVGLSRAAAAAGLPLHGTRTVEGLFATSAAGKQAAQKCCDDGYLAAVPTEPSAAAVPEGGGTATLVRKKTTPALYTITDAGLAFLFSRVSPREVLEDFLRTLQSRQRELSELCGLTRQTLASTEALHAGVQKALDHVAGPTAPPGGNLKALFSTFLSEPPRCQSPPTTTAGVETCLLDELQRWQQSGASEDYPLPQLYRHAEELCRDLSIGAFHDVLRQLHEAGKIYLHPWTGPLYDLPEPPYALLVGHEIAYYASLKVV